MPVQCNSMANEQNMTAQVPGSTSREYGTPDAWSRAILRRALKASLATINRETGYPYASLITVATLSDGSPVTLISQLAEHTKNLEIDPRASILFDETSGLGDPLEGARVSVAGKLEKASDSAARARFLSRHPSALVYACLLYTSPSPR